MPSKIASSPIDPASQGIILGQFRGLLEAIALIKMV